MGTIFNTAPAYRASENSGSSAGLLGKVLGIVGFGFLVTAFGAFVLSGIPFWAAAILGLCGLGLIIFINAKHDSPELQLGLFYVFTFIEGGCLAPWLHHKIKTIGAPMITEAALVTAAGMFLIGLISYMFSINYRKLAGVGLGLLLLLLGVMIVNVFFHFVHPHVIDWLVLGVFSLLTLIDFARIRNGGDGATATELALGIYLDALNIFTAIVDLLGKD